MPSFLPLGQDSLTKKASCAGFGMPTAMIRSTKMPTLTFGRNGNFVLAEANGRVEWQTNTANKGVTGIKLLRNGNLVLHDKNGKFTWQGFDHPTNTLLAGQSVKINGRDKLVSRTSDMVGSGAGPGVVH
ncbi:hypothetical protein LWI29_003432 [Acer saccharum]|uniref:Bulb-type lectin domain-containing protein n=1 Tax=Acer saccharum TaxID=4024 RepID=A0AA39SS98_ACESA|nr:hypothetical protein LWI29_003432 [Acer saccharum]